MLNLPASTPRSDAADSSKFLPLLRLGRPLGSGGATDRTPGSAFIVLLPALDHQTGHLRSFTKCPSIAGPGRSSAAPAEARSVSESRPASELLGQRNDRMAASIRPKGNSQTAHFVVKVSNRCNRRHVGNSVATSVAREPVSTSIPCSKVTNDCACVVGNPRKASVSVS